jgi:hypothetical protein
VGLSFTLCIAHPRWQIVACGFGLTLTSSGLYKRRSIVDPKATGGLAVSR